MSHELEFYLKCADESAAEARGATLDNVRERALRSEAAWRAMAARRQGIDDNRRRAAEAKAAELGDI